MEVFSGYSWIFVALSIIGNIFIIHHKRTLGYSTWTVANVGWVGYNAYISEYSQMSLFVVYLFLSIYGIYTENVSDTKKKVPIIVDEPENVEPI